MGFLGALAAELASIPFFGSPECLLKNQLTNAHSWPQSDWYFAMIDHLKANMAVKTRVNRWRSDVDAEAEPRKRAFAFHSSGNAVM